MKILYREEIKAAEAKAVEAGITMEELMEHAGEALAEAAMEQAGCPEEAVILCGKGNNGGDGFVCAAALYQAGANVTVILVEGEPASSLAQQAFAAMPDEINLLSGEEEDLCFQALSRCDMLIDCVYGFGFHGELPEHVKKYLQWEGKVPEECCKIACDVPSGIDCNTGRADEGAFQADLTVTFSAAKPGCLSYPGKRFCGKVQVMSVGIPEEILRERKSDVSLLQSGNVFSLLPDREEESNKGDYGTLLMVCGSYGMAGACILAAKAALRSGVGLLRLAVDERIYPILAQAVPEAVFTILPWHTDINKARLFLQQAAAKASACVIGCGLGENASKVCKALLPVCKVPLVLDADGINALAGDPALFQEIQVPFAMTPHPGEMGRLMGMTAKEVQQNRLELARQGAARFGCTLVLKGAATVIARKDKVWINTTGNPGMAKGGSGDVLAGIIGSLAAQGLSLEEACRAGVWLHGRAGDLCAGQLSQRAMLPSDLVDCLPEVFQESLDFDY